MGSGENHQDPTFQRCTLHSLSQSLPLWLLSMESQWFPLLLRSPPPSSTVGRRLATLRLELSEDLTQMRGEGPSTMSLTNLDSGQLFESRSYQARPAEVSNKQLKHLQFCNWIFTPRVEETFLVVYCLKLDSCLIAIFPGSTNVPDGHSSKTNVKN